MSLIRADFLVVFFTTGTSARWRFRIACFRRCRKSDAMISPTDLVRRIQKLDKVVAEKNDHIAELKEVIRRLENGRVMRALSRWCYLPGAPT